MQKDEQGKEKMQASTQDELSPVWRELLGGLPVEGDIPSTPAATEIPTLKSDPWSLLVHEEGIKVVDMRKNRLHISDGDVEQMLQRMQEEQPIREDEPSSFDAQ